MHCYHCATSDYDLPDAISFGNAVPNLNFQASLQPQPLPTTQKTSSVKLKRQKVQWTLSKHSPHCSSFTPFAIATNMTNPMPTAIHQTKSTLRQMVQLNIAT